VSKNFFNEVLDSLEFNKSRERKDRISPHDFRRVLSTLANESELFAPIDIEMALGHETRSGVEKHYNNNATYLNRKRAVLDWIADKVDSLIEPELDVYNLLVVV
jgi:integrase